MADREARFKALLERIQRTDSRLHDEIQSNRPTPGLVHEAVANAAGAAGGVASLAVAVAAPQMALETIVRKTGRPVLQVFRDEPKLDFRDAESEVWRDRLRAARTPLVRAIRAVGRVELTNHPDFKWVGTGWLVKPDIIITNRHVAQTFGRKRGDAFVFRSSFLGPISASIDFLEEADNMASNEMVLKEILHIEDDDGPDFAFLRVEPSGTGNLAEPIALNMNPTRPDQFVAVIGYPARDSRIPDQDLMESIFGDVFDSKRLAPGQLMEAANDGAVEHDCSTLGGNSGSVVLDLDSGQAVALHFAGTYLTANFAVPAAQIADRLSKLGSSNLVGAPTSTPVVGSETAVPQQTPIATTTVQPQTSGTTSISCVIPIRINIEVGSPQTGAAPQITVSSTATPTAITGGLLDAEESAITTEAPIADYSDREGFDTDFLDLSPRVALPKIIKDAAQIVEFKIDGKTQTELKYHHFSVVMHEKRRMCFYSAANIDGKLAKRTIRPSWRFDPRIPNTLQIKGECYGNPPKYSRGHMTRREDPAWGTTQAQADRGCADSMHVTNTVPQVQSFNGGVWLSLEDYALQHAKQDKQRISVITGPFFTASDPVQFGIKVPKAFWKVLIFVHDETGKLTATGYSISQESVIPNTEFVFGEFGAHQRSLKWIEGKAGISFGSLTAHDPMNTANEAMETAARPLASLDQIRFV